MKQDNVSIWLILSLVFMVAVIAYLRIREGW